MLIRRRDLAPRVPAVLLSMPVGAVWYGVSIFVKLLTFRRAAEASPGREDTVLGHAHVISCPGSREMKHVRHSQTTRRPPRVQIPSRDRYCDRHITVPPFEGQTQEEKNLALWQASPPRHICFPVFRGWSLLGRFVCSSETFSKMNNLLEGIAMRRPPSAVEIGGTIFLNIKRK